MSIAERIALCTYMQPNAKLIASLLPIHSYRLIIRKRLGGTEK